ncbi:MAG: hypothetical protein WBP67_04150, partial [Thermoanaerobaculia bacterium]
PDILQRPNAMTLLMDAFEEWLTDDEIVDQKATADAAWDRLIEDYLHDSAVGYEDAGFEPPHLQKVNDDGRVKYVVYLADFGESPRLIVAKNAWGVNFHVLGFMAINQPKFAAARGDLLETTAPGYRGVELYRTLAHELFHSIQFKYDVEFGSLGLFPPFPTPAGRQVVIEGGADGAATFLAAKKFPGYLENWAYDEELTGGYPYYLGFLLDGPDPDDWSPYFTSSFWFHVAERFGSLSVIEYLFRRSLPNYPGDDKDRVRWLNGALEDHPGVEEGLYTVYPHFLTELASYGAGRFKRVAEDSWESWTFGYCPTVEMTPQTEVDAKYEIEMFNEMSGQCVEVKWNGFPENGALKVEVIGSDKEVLDQINLGISSSTQSGGTCWQWRSGLPKEEQRESNCLAEKVRVLTGPTEGTWARTWELPPAGYGEEGDATFILTNAAVEPWKTKKADGVTVRFGFSRTEDQEGKTRGPAGAEHIRVPVPLPDFMRLRTYGIDPSPLPPEVGLQFPLAPISIPQDDGSSGESPISAPGFRVLADPRKPIPLGYTGPLYGSVMILDPENPMGMSSSGTAAFCRSRDEMKDLQLIGQVLRAEEDQLKVHIQVDICEVQLGSPAPPKVVDRIDAIVVLPFGWRYFEQPPLDEITPGVEIFVERFHARLEGRIGGRWPYAGPMSGPTPSPTDGGVGVPGLGGMGGSSSSGGDVADCDCSCEGFQEFKELGRQKDDPEAQEKLQAMGACAMKCMGSWIGCKKK